MYLIAGLGNPGKEYENTRHNVGFKVLDALASDTGIEIKKARFEGLIGTGKINGEKVILLKPQTFMNLSGSSVRKTAMYYDIPKEHVIVIYDDIDIPFRSIRIRKSGGPGTHNGMKSVCKELGITDFPRIRIGIGNNSDNDLIDYVMGKMSKDEIKLLDETAKEAAEAVKDIIKLEIDNAMTKHNITYDK